MKYDCGVLILYYIIYTRWERKIIKWYFKYDFMHENCENILFYFEFKQTYGRKVSISTDAFKFPQHTHVFLFDKCCCLSLSLSLSYPSLKRKLRSLHLKCSYIHARHSSVKRQQLYPPLIHPSAQQATSLKYYVGNRQIHAQTRTRIRMQDTACAKLYALLNYNAKILSSILAAKCNYITKLVTFWSLQVCSTWLAQSSNENWERESEWLK